MLQNIFKSAEILDINKHNNLKLKSNETYDFSKDISFCPIGQNEMFNASKSMIIAFYGNEKDLVPVILLGKDKNMMLDEKTKWKESFYVPAVLRAYPFGLTKLDDKRLVVFDNNPKYISDDGSAIIESNELNEKGKLVVNYVTSINDQLDNAKNIVDELVKYNLFRYVTFNLEKNGERLDLGSYYIIDEEKLNRLDAKTIKKFLKNNYLNFIYLHLNSLNNRYEF